MMRSVLQVVVVLFYHNLIRLVKHEGVIFRGLSSYVPVGVALVYLIHIMHIFESVIRWGNAFDLISKVLSRRLVREQGQCLAFFCAFSYAEHSTVLVSMSWGHTKIHRTSRYHFCHHVI